MNQRTTKNWYLIAAALSASVAAGVLTSCGGGDQPPLIQITTRPALATAPTRPAHPATAATATAPSIPIGQPTTLPGGLIIEEVKIGDGPVVANGQTVSISYTGTLDDGTVFDATSRSGKPLIIVLGSGQVIEGWDKGIPGMRVGGKRKLTIPPNLAYGARAIQGIPANSTLHFDLEVIHAR